MELLGILHLPEGSFAFITGEQEIEVRLRTGAEAQQASVIYGDKYDWENSVSRRQMSLMGRDQLFAYWNCKLHCPSRRVRYGFEVLSEAERIWLNENGFMDKPLAGQMNLFDFPWIHPDDGLNIPDWVKEAVFYQIFPERFANGDKSNDPPKLLAWDAKPGPRSFLGGDLQGIIDNLDYIVQLGANAIYLTPIFHAPSNHKYDTIDYLTIDPHFGDFKTFKTLVDSCHQRGVKVVLDGVFNHIGWESPQFRDLLEKGEESQYAHWFHIHHYPITTHPRPNYDSFGFVASMPKLNTANPEVREFLLNVGEWWVREAGIDGWRLDVANEVDHGFWREFRRRIKAVNPEAYIVGEIMHLAGPWLRGDQFDGVMNYRLTEALTEFIAIQSIDAAEFTRRLNSLVFYYQHNAAAASLNLLDSHDTPRFLNKCSKDKKLQKLAALALFTLPGVPCIYYGDEIGMEGEQDPDCRRGMIWDPKLQDQDMLAWYKKLIELRKTHPALSRGQISIYPGQPAGWRRAWQKQELAVFINPSSEPSPLPLEYTGEPDLLSGRRLEEVPAKGGIILQIPL
jgi:glycosidase